MRALVTGGRGFVGTWLTRHLEAEGDQIIPTNEEINVVDAAAVSASMDEIKPQVVYHLAGWASVGSSWQSPGEAFSVNTVGTVNVLDAARRLESPPKVLVVSSAEVYGRAAPEEMPLTEAHPLRPLSPYAASKAAAEIAAQQAVAGFGLHVVVARPFNHIGPGQREGFVVSDLARRLVQAERAGTGALAMGNPAPRRDLTDVRDVVRAYRLLVDRGEPGHAYNVCSGESIMIGDLARRMIELSGRDVELQPGSVALRPADVPELRGDSSKLERATGWKPSISLDETLEDVLAHWRGRVEA